MLRWFLISKGELVEFWWGWEVLSDAEQQSTELSLANKPVSTDLNHCN